MNAQEKALARIIFQRTVLSSDGQAYENLFVAAMQKTHSDFTPIKPQGSLGDRKNDGYIPSLGHYYQVFAPENLNKSKSDAVKKLKDDFAGLMSYWSKTCPVQCFSFVMNDKYKGSLPTIETDLAVIKSKHALKVCASFLAKDLEDLVFTQSDDVIFSIVGYVPDPNNITNIDFSILNDLVQHIRENKPAITKESVLRAPDFTQKLIFNGLSKHVSSLLNAASYQVGAVNKYFELNSEFTKQEIRDHLSGVYESLSTTEMTVADGSELNSSDILFFDILQNICSEDNESIQNASLVLMAYFFESCDIFKEPVENE